jgi:hypothetical protein
MFYKLSNTSLRESNLVVLLRNWRFARLMDWISSLLDIIFRVSLILRQSSRLKTTDLGLPSGVVMNSISGNSSAFGMFKSPYFFLNRSLANSKIRVNKLNEHKLNELNLNTPFSKGAQFLPFLKVYDSQRRLGGITECHAKYQIVIPCLTRNPEFSVADIEQEG